MTRLKDMLDFLIPHYVDEGKSYLTITIGCTGGKHRSVALAEEIREHFVRQRGAGFGHAPRSREGVSRMKESAPGLLVVTHGRWP